ncbi:MAG: SUMF1/EgtB/PvdO family nonheme iron enzyme [Kiritimatiellia bacterium]
MDATNYPVAYYPSLADLPGGFGDDRYKTTHLLMRLIRKGTFAMGTPPDEPGLSDDWVWDVEPKTVTLTQDFYIGVYEVTQRQWELVMGTNPSNFQTPEWYAKRPVENVSYNMVREVPESNAMQDPNGYFSPDPGPTSFMGKIRAKAGLESFDLPTNAQWEYACRAGTRTGLHNGTDLTPADPPFYSDEYYTNRNSYYCPNLIKIARCRINSWGYPVHGTNYGTYYVGSYQPNAWDLYDMLGNVAELVLDETHSLNYWPSPLIDPVCTNKGFNSPSLWNGHRGGDWDDAARCRAGAFTPNTPDCVTAGAAGTSGFRASMTLPRAADAPVQDGTSSDTSPVYVLDLTPPEERPLTVRGRVLKAADNTPLPGISVSLEGSNVVTSADGAFAFENIPFAFGAGELAVTNTPGYARHLEMLAPEPGATEIVVPDILLKPSGYKVTELRGGDGIFLKGVPVKQKFTALVDWDGNEAGGVEFSANGTVLQTVATSAAQAELVVDMDAAFQTEPPGGSNTLQAVAVAKSGQRSAPFAREIAFVQMPQILGAPLQRGESSGWKSEGMIVEFELSVPEDADEQAESVDMRFLGSLGMHMKLSGGFSYNILSGEWNASVGASREKKNETETRVPAINWLNKSAYFPSFKVANNSWDFKVTGNMGGTLMKDQEAITFDSMGIGLGLKFEKFLTSFYLTDFIPVAQWIRMLDWARGTGFDVNSLQRADVFGVIDVSTSVKANLNDIPLHLEAGTLDTGFGVRFLYEPNLYLAKAKVQGGGMLTPSFQLAPKFKFMQVNGKVAGSIAIVVMSYKAYDLKFVVINETYVPSGAKAAGIAPNLLAVEGGFVALPLAEPAGDGLIERPNLALGPERFLAAGDMSIRILAALAPETLADPSALAAFRAMDPTPVTAKGRVAPLSAEPLADPPVQADLPLVENVYPESEPALTACGSELMLLYVGDNGSPNTLQCTDIRWTRWDGVQWSTPAPILADTRAEFAPRVAFDGDGNAIAVWERVADADFDGDLPDMLGQMEIAWSRWDRTTGIWTAPQTLTTNAQPDHAPLLAGTAEDGGVLAVWSRNAENLLVGTNGAPDQVLWSKWTPATQTWSAEQTLIPAVANRLSHSLACSTNGYAIYGYTVDPDGVQTNDLDQEVFVCQRTSGTWGAPQAFTDNEDADKQIHLAVGPGNVPVAVWRQGDDLVMRHGIGGATQLVREDSTTVAFADFAMTLGPDGHLALLWQEMNGQGSDAHYSVYDPASGTWGEDALLCADMPLERSFAPVWDAAGNLTVAYQKVQLNLVTRTFELEEGGSIEVENMPESGRTDLYVTKRSLVQDLAILPGDFTSDGFNFLPGEMVTLSAVVRNLGDLPVLDPVVAFFDGDPDAGGVLIGETNVVGLMAAASTNVVQTVWIVPEPATAHALYAVVNRDDLAAEANATNNVQVLSVGGTDLLASLVRYSARPDGAVRVVAQVKNDGAPAASASALSIRKSDETGGELGPVLATVAVPELPAGRLAQVAIDLPPGTQALDDEFYRIAANSDGTVSESFTNNNGSIFSVHVMIDTDGDGMPDSWENAHGFDPGGTNSGTDPDYGAYSLTAEAFFMDTNEVTMAKWDAVYAWALTHDYGFDNAGSARAVADGAYHPVNTVNWFDCVKWCNARSEMEGREPAYYTDSAFTQVYRAGQTLSPFVKANTIGYRLPTATEWQYAARGGESSLRFPWGDTIDHTKANYRGEPSSSSYDLGYAGYDTRYSYYGYQPYGTYPFTAPVNSFPEGVNGYGLMDMGGNVQEWVFAWLSGYEGVYRLYQGGGWGSVAYSCRIAHASSSTPDSTNYYYGFRTVVTAIPQ